MAAEPFTPIGAQARWRTIYELLVPLSVGAVATYDQLAAALKLDSTRDRATIQMAARRALLELLENYHRTCEPIRNVGYRVVEPAHHLVLAESRDRRARLQLRRGYDVATKVDLSEVEPAVRKALDALALGFSRQMEINRRIEAKQQRHDEAIMLLQQQVALLQDQPR